MTLKPSLSVFAVILLTWPVFCWGALTWENQKIELTSEPMGKEITGIFRFKNSGSTTVTITAVQPSCGCTTAELAKRVYAPGETGEIKAVYKPGGATGEQHKTIVITTDDASVKPTELTLNVTIPEVLNCSPRMLLWRIGDKTDEKTVVVSPTGSNRISKIEIAPVAPDSGVIVRMESIAGAQTHRLFIHPSSTLTIGQASISCVAQFADGTSQPFTVFVLIR